MKDRCDGKVRYRTEEAAVMVLAVTGRREPKRLRKRFNAYFCRSCGGWHLGHLSLKAFRAIQGEES